MLNVAAFFDGQRAALALTVQEIVPQGKVVVVDGAIFVHVTVSTGVGFGLLGHVGVATQVVGQGRSA